MNTSSLALGAGVLYSVFLLYLIYLIPLIPVQPLRADGRMQPSTEIATVDLPFLYRRLYRFDAPSILIGAYTAHNQCAG